MRHWLAWLLLPWSFAGPSQATVLVDYTFDALVRESALIVRAQILDRFVEGPHAGHADDIHTVVTLRVVHVLKGDAQPNEIELSFLGGTLNNEVLDISGQFIPRVGEEAILFIDDPHGRHINPLTGWFQGYFPIQQAAGQTYLDLSDRPDLILANLNADPLLKKLLSLRVSEAEIEKRFPGYTRFLLEDFLTAIEIEVAATELP